MTVAAGGCWYAVQTHANQEDKAAFNLTRQGFEVFLPKYSRLRRHARKVERVRRPLFSGYLFVAIDMARQRWRAIQSTYGVVRLVTCGDRPLPVPRPVIEELLDRQGPDGCIRLDSCSSWKAGDSVKVMYGPFADRLGLFEGVTDNQRALILLDFLGGKVRAVVDADAIAAA